MQGEGSTGKAEARGILEARTDAGVRGFVPRLGAVGAAGALVDPRDGRRALPPSGLLAVRGGSAHLKVVFGGLGESL